MAAASILHVGEDFCHRVPLMERAGFIVLRSDCSVPAVHNALAQGGTFSAITFHNDFYCPEDTIVSTARTLSAAPLVLFENPAVHCEEHLFDRVIFGNAPPTVWLKSLQEAIEDGRSLRKVSEQLRQESSMIRAESERLRSESARGRKKRSESHWSGETGEQ